MWSISTNTDQCWTKAVTIDGYSPLFATIRDHSPLLAIVHTIRTIRYSLLAIRVSVPDTPQNTVTGLLKSVNSHWLDLVSFDPYIVSY